MDEFTSENKVILPYLFLSYWDTKSYEYVPNPDNICDCQQKLWQKNWGSWVM